MNKTITLLGVGIVLTVGSAMAPVVASASGNPARVCADAAGTLCTSVVVTDLGAGGQEVESRPLPTGRGDAKDHPNYGQITPTGRGDAKDHPNYGQITPTGRGDAKDHPNYGQITPTGRGDAKDHPNYGQITPTGPSIYLQATPE